MSNATGNVVDLAPALVVGAHPDDETFMAGGLLATLARNGATVATITATRGEAGYRDESEARNIGDIREAELRAALAVLGVRDHTWLGYRDGTCSEVDEAEAASRVREHLERLRPRSIFTFGPDGMTGHPDHKAVARWVARAFRDAALAETTLYHATVTPEWAERFLPLFAPFNVFLEPGTPPVTPEEDLAVAYELPPDVLEVKWQAITCHRSQLRDILEAGGADALRESSRSECFRLGGWT